MLATNARASGWYSPRHLISRRARKSCSQRWLMPDASSSVPNVPDRKEREEVEAPKAEMETMRREHQVWETRTKMALPASYYLLAHTTPTECLMPRGRQTTLVDT